MEDVGRPGADPASPFTGATQPLIEALEIELSAAREEVGAVVELDADLPGELTAGGSLLVLRAVQELLAGVVRRAEETTVQLRADGLDVVIGVRAVDEDGATVSPEDWPCRRRSIWSQLRTACGSATPSCQADAT